MKAFVFLISFVFFSLVGVEGNAQCNEKEVELMTACPDEIHWSKKIRLTSKKNANKKAVLYLKNGVSAEHPKITPVIEVSATHNTLISTKKGYKYVADLQKGDEVFCKNNGGMINAYEIGLVYVSK